MMSRYDLWIEKGLSLSNVLLWIMNIAISFAFPSMNLHFGPAITFIILTVFQLLCILYFNVFNILYGIE